MKGLLLTNGSGDSFTSIKDELSIGGIEPEWTLKKESETLAKAEITKLLQEHDFTIIDGELSLSMGPFVKKRSVSSHFLDYVDFVTPVKNELWGQSVFSEVFLELLRNSIENQDFKGPVIFLGDNEKVFPIIQVLAGFGFEDFVFLSLPDQATQFAHYNPARTGLLQAKISKVDSTTFIQSQKEYSFCFVMEEKYSTQTLEDMSYFHFLSSRSIVYDMSGRSNFLFKEVKALGVTVADYSRLQTIWAAVLRQRIQEIASKAG